MATSKDKTLLAELATVYQEEAAIINILLYSALEGNNRQSLAQALTQKLKIFGANNSASLLTIMKKVSKSFAPLETGLVEEETITESLNEILQEIHTLYQAFRTSPELDFELYESLTDADVEEEDFAWEEVEEEIDNEESLDYSYILQSSFVKSLDTLEPSIRSEILDLLQEAKNQEKALKKVINHNQKLQDKLAKTYASTPKVEAMAKKFLADISPLSKLEHQAADSLNLKALTGSQEHQSQDLPIAVKDFIAQTLELGSITTTNFQDLQLIKDSYLAKAIINSLPKIPAELLRSQNFTKELSALAQEHLQRTREAMFGLKKEQKPLNEVFKSIEVIEDKLLKYNHSLTIANSFNPNTKLNELSVGDKKPSNLSLDYSIYGLATPEIRQASPWNNLGTYLEESAINNKIHCFDISHSNGMYIKGSAVAFKDKEALANEYRHFNIEGVIGGDDVASIRQAVEKRYRSEINFLNLPLTIMIDGAGPQVNAANEIMDELTPVILSRELYQTLVFKGRNLLHYLSKTNYRFYDNAKHGYFALASLDLLLEKFNDPKHSSSFANSLSAYLLLVKLYQAILNKKPTAAFDDYQELLASVLYYCNLQQIDKTKKEYSLDNLQKSEEESSFYHYSALANLPATLTTIELKELLAHTYCCLRYMHPFKIIGVTKQEGRRLYQEKFIDGDTLEELEIPKHSPEQYILLKIRDASHNYANRKRVEKRDSQDLSAKDKLLSIPHLGPKAVEKLYSYYKTIPQMLSALEKPGALDILVRKVGLTSKAANSLLDNLNHLYK